MFLLKNKILAKERYLEHQPRLPIKERLLHLVRLTSSSPLPVFTLYLRFILPLIISTFREREFIISSQSALTKSGMHHNTGKHYNCYQKSVVQVKNGTRSYPGIHTSTGFFAVRTVAAAAVSTVDVFAGPS